MNTLLLRYCKCNNITSEDMIGKSHAKGLPLHRHIFAYCVKKTFPSIKLREIGEILGAQKPASIGYGIKVIRYKISPMTANGKIVEPPSDIKLICDQVTAFLSVCKSRKRSDLILPKKD